MSSPFLICSRQRWFLCVLDQVTFCKIGKVCDLHDRYTTGE